jgi:hypothetical protein
MPTLLILFDFITWIASGENYTSGNPNVSPPKATWWLNCNGPEETDLRSVKPDSACVECWTSLPCRLKIYQATRGTDNCGSLYSSSREGYKWTTWTRHVQFCPEATEFLKDVSFDINVLWDMGPRSFVDCYRYIGEYCWSEFMYTKVGGS